MVRTRTYQDASLCVGRVDHILYNLYQSTFDCNLTCVCHVEIKSIIYSLLFIKLLFIIILIYF